MKQVLQANCINSFWTLTLYTHLWCPERTLNHDHFQCFVPKYSSLHKENETKYVYHLSHYSLWSTWKVNFKMNLALSMHSALAQHIFPPQHRSSLQMWSKTTTIKGLHRGNTNLQNNIRSTYPLLTVQTNIELNGVFMTKENKLARKKQALFTLLKSISCG